MDGFLRGWAATPWSLTLFAIILKKWPCKTIGINGKDVFIDATKNCPTGPTVPRNVLNMRTGGMHMLSWLPSKWKQYDLNSQQSALRSLEGKSTDIYINWPASQRHYRSKQNATKQLSKVVQTPTRETRFSLLFSLLLWFCASWLRYSRHLLKHTHCAHAV